LEYKLKAIERSRQLRALMKQEIFPLLEERGFQPLKHSGLCYGFIRLQADQAQVIDIQWDKYHGPSFAFNFGQTPVVMQDGEPGFYNPYMEQWFPLAEINCGQFPYSRLAFGRFRRNWFRYTWLASLLPSGGPHTAVERVISFLPLVDSWFAGDPSSIAIVDHMNHREANPSTGEK